MPPRRELTAAAIARKPRLVWEAFVDLLVSEPFERMSELQRYARLAFAYDALVTKGGHRRYFESDEVFHAREAIEALDRLGLWQQARLLERSLALWEATGRQPSRLLEMLARAALGDELAEVDEAYGRCSPSVTQGLERTLAEQRDEFLIVLDD